MHGGEITQAAFDEGIRHSISKFSNLHFVIHNIYKKRLVSMGENPIQFLIMVLLRANKLKNVFLTNRVFK